MRILALEASTTSAKAMLYDTKSRTYEEKIKAYGKMYDEEVLHDADKVFDCMAKIGRELAGGREISIISLSGTWHSVLLCDRRMRPATPVYPWSYTGAAPLCGRLREDASFVEDYYQKTGCMVNATYPFFKLLFLREQGYDLKDYYIMGQGTYNTYRLTGERVASRCMISGTGLMNIHTREYDDEILKMAGIARSQLSRLTESNHTQPLSEEGARILGLRPGIPVIVANSDGGLNQIGVGAIKENVMTFSVGTSGAMRISTAKPMIPKSPSTWCYLSPKGWLSGAATAGCCNCIDWFVEHVAAGRTDYSQLEQGEDEILDTPIFLPFLFGERCPGWNDKRGGGFAGLKAGHDIKDMYRGVQQGILFNLYHCYRLLTEVAGEPEKIKLSGGILHSRVWTQMCADIFGKEMEIDQSKQSSLMGAVILAREIIGDLKDISDYEPSVKTTVRPDMARNERYRKQFERYLQMYTSMEQE